MNKNPNLYDILEYLKAEGLKQTILELLLMFRNKEVALNIMVDFFNHSSMSATEVVKALEALDKD